MRTEDLDYELPERLIAQEPLPVRSASRLLVLRRADGSVQHRMFVDLPALLEPGDLLVRNETQVTARRVTARRAGGGHAELLVLEAQGAEAVALARPAKRIRPGDCLDCDGVRALVLEDLGQGRRRVRFEDGARSFASVGELGETPLPPYVRTKLEDPGRYDTVYARVGGSAAAPTAGLHFDKQVLEALARRGVAAAGIALSVGVDTFRPVTAERLEDHPMHGEDFDVPDLAARAVAACQGRVVAVGTTTCRALEAAAVGPRELRPGPGRATLLILPGHGFRCVDALLTNFHMPRTTMLGMVAAFCGPDALLAAYKEAVRLEYRFLSFGDAMLVI